MTDQALSIRPVQVTDAESLIEAHRASRDFHAPFVAPPLDRASFDQWFACTVKGRHVALLALYDGEPAGVVNFGEIVMGRFRSCYCGYYAMVSFAGRGLMGDVLRSALIFARDELGLHRVEANIQPTNHCSIALVKRLGFRREGLSSGYLFIDGAWRDHERWAILLDRMTPDGGSGNL